MGYSLWLVSPLDTHIVFTIQTNLLGDMGYCSCVVRVVGHTKYVQELGNVELYSNPSVVIDTVADGTEVSGSLREVAVGLVL